jgi:hypothetical protein
MIKVLSFCPYVNSCNLIENVESEDAMEDIYPMDAAVEVSVEPTLLPMPLIRRVVTCSGCGIQGHTYTTCPTRFR